MIKGWALRKLNGYDKVFPAWFDHLEESFSFKEVQFKRSFPPAKTSWPTAEKVNEAPEITITAAYFS